MVIIVSVMLLALGVDFAALISWLQTRWRGRGYATRHYK
jgi:hypothetical protein